MRDHLRDWYYETYPLDAEAVHFGPGLGFKKLWDEKRHNGKLPAWCDFDLMDFQRWWGWIVVEDVVSIEDFELRYRLWGTRVVTFLDFDATGKSTKDLREIYLWPEDEVFLRNVITEKLIGISGGSVRRDDISYRKYCYIVLPLADDGVTTDKILSLIIPSDNFAG